MLCKGMHIYIFNFDISFIFCIYLKYALPRTVC